MNSIFFIFIILIKINKKKKNAKKINHNNQQISYSIIRLQTF